MTPIQAGDELRTAAKLMRERARAATPGPWTTTEAHGRDIADEGWSDVRVRALGRDVAVTYMTSVLEGDPHEANAPYIASMHPVVALAVAAWLDSKASDADATLGLDTPDCPNCGEGCGGHDPEWGCDRCAGPLEDCGCGFNEALAVARAYLGTEQEDVTS